MVLETVWLGQWIVDSGIDSKHSSRFCIVVIKLKLEYLVRAGPDIHFMCMSFQSRSIVNQNVSLNGNEIRQKQLKLSLMMEILGLVSFNISKFREFPFNWKLLHDVFRSNMNEKHAIYSHTENGNVLSKSIIVLCICVQCFSVQHPFADYLSLELYYHLYHNFPSHGVTKIEQEIAKINSLSIYNDK